MMHKSPEGTTDATPVSTVSRLSAREIEVLSQVARGQSSAEIATLLGISAHTVETHIRRILEKMHVASRTQAAVRAAQAGVLPLV
ncbi:response regulator transcription factor [Pelagovum pacificum]|uniref:Helix-turn-helix transcriptional regulator n=1 Tax=Pelagovum pacificum TaxID=2588711 RepID=A0A5C5G7M3_9RHOB|nr:helix-turn-helix transcriptional regulator [Pelagovum pacificum]QQA41848.1 helix-turn-helix transcriptional regulator [Pelagovum pacificum]TNY30709.1 helix-turn-helix transcriptional regulator [Pelagovum pacificum]